MAVSAGLSLRKDGVGSDLPFRRVLIANRGEIALRILRACRELGLETVAVYSDADARAAHVRLADAAVRIGPPAPAESYLNIEAILGAANTTGAQAIHPGYGFLAERAAFARRVTGAGLVFVGPTADAIEALGDKLRARHIARDAGVPVVPGTLEPAAIDRPDQLPELVEEAASIGFPLLVKAAAGGGGRGMRRVVRSEDLPAALIDGSREAADAFGDGRVYLEREVAPARHVEVQLLGDATGRVISLGERDCSIQRRHQKLVEEAPAPGLSDEERRRLHGMAVRVGEVAHLTNAATAEFLRTPDGAYYFLEVNTRLQVEHGVTELVGGVDIVREQLFLAAGRPMSEVALAAAGRAASPGSHAIEVRISAEDPGHDFAPAPGLIRRWEMPSGSGVRVDTAAEAGERVPPEYDNLLAKVMVHAADRAAAIDRLAGALRATEIAGIQTTLPFHRFVADHAGFRAGELSTGWVADHWDGPAAAEGASRLAQVAAALAPASTRRLASPGDVPVQGGDRARSREGNGRDGAAWAEAALEAGIDRWPVADRLPAADQWPGPDPWRAAEPSPAAHDWPAADKRPEPDRSPRMDRAPDDGHGGMPRPGAVRVTFAPGTQAGVGPAGAGPDVVELGRDGVVTIDGEPQRAGLAPGEPPRARLEAEDGNHDILLIELPDPRRTAGGVRRLEVVVDGWRFEIDVESEARARLRERATSTRGDTSKGGPVELRAIIPGRVVSVDVAEGDTVDAGGRLLVVEAMKMQNELRSPRGGTVGRVAVGAGQTVELGDLLMVVE
jgi:acetyl/propionyl-CoA carboxylase alpha subunit